MAVVVAIGFSSLSQRFDVSVYDWLAKHKKAQVTQPRSIVLIDIEPSSINKYGPWPFSRHLHAKLINQLTSVGVSSIAYNIAFVTPDTRPISKDHELTAAIARNNHVVLPLLAENGRELLPLNKASLSGATYAHTDFSVDHDQILRRHFLYAGVAYPRWPSLALAALHRYAPVKSYNYSGLRSPYLHIGFSQQWSRDFEVLLPFGVDDFARQLHRVKFKDVLEGNVEAEQLKNKAIFVGIYEPTLEPKIMTPSGSSYSATLLQAYWFYALEQGQVISPILPVWSVLLAVLVSLSLSVMLLWRLPLMVKITLMIGVILAAVMPVILLYLGYWISVLPLLAGVIISPIMIIICRQLRGLRFSRSSGDIKQ